MTRPRWTLGLLPLLALVVAGCEEDLLSTVTGNLVVEVVNVRSSASELALRVGPRAEAGITRTRGVERPRTTERFEQLAVGLVEVEVQARTATAALDRVRAFPIAVVQDRDAIVVIDFAQETFSVTPPPENTPGVCLGPDRDGDGKLDPIEILCALCDESDGRVTAVADDPACGRIDCAGLDAHALSGDNTAAGTSQCILTAHPPIETGRCAGLGACKSATADTCPPPARSTVAEAGLCRIIQGCVGATPPTVVTVEDGTPCGVERACRSGACVDETPPNPEVGCADGTREGFQNQTSHPDIAACAGGWSVPGVTIPNPSPACGRAGGNGGARPEGDGCAAVDLCQAGWHVCRGYEEVQQVSPSGCADAVPAGTPDKSLFFAVAQNSDNNSVCGGAGTNDVFGCGNLGTVLDASRSCGPLNRVLASTQPNRCGFNEAEPNLGPWRCLGPNDSHLREGALVTKDGCPGSSCSYEGRPIGNSDKGGVLCCRD